MPNERDNPPAQEKHLDVQRSAVRPAGRMMIYADRQPWRGRSIAVAMCLEAADGATWAARPIEWERIEEGEERPPVLELQPEVAQMLMDELWRAGLRPTEGSGSAGSLAATERHLKDMQTIAFGALRKAGVSE